MSAKSKDSYCTATKQHPSTPLYGCDVFGCKSTFAHKSDSRRHKLSVHGTRQPCPFDRCGYATGRVDKMNEHMRKVHDVPRPASQAAESSPSPHTPQRYSGSETQDEVTTKNQTFEQSTVWDIPTSSPSNTIFYTPSCDDTISISNTNLSSEQYDDFAMNHPVHSYSHTLHGIGNWAYDHTLASYPAWDMPQTTDVPGRNYAPGLSLGSSNFTPRFEAPALGFFDDIFYGVENTFNGGDAFDHQ